MALAGNKVKVTFTVQSGLHLGRDHLRRRQGAEPGRDRVHGAAPVRDRQPERADPAVADHRALQPRHRPLRPRLRDPAVQHPGAREVARGQQPGPERHPSPAGDQPPSTVWPGFSNVLGSEQDALATIVTQGANLTRRALDAQPPAVRPVRAGQPGPHGPRAARRRSSSCCTATSTLEPADHVDPVGQPLGS